MVQWSCVIGGTTALPMGVAPEIKLNCLQLRLNSIFLQSKSLLPMGVKRGLDLELRLALCDLLCIQPVWLTARVCSALGAYWMLLHSNEMFEFSISSLAYCTNLFSSESLLNFLCTRMKCSSSPSARWLTSYAFVVDVSADVFDALCVRWDVTVRSHCQY